MGIGNTRMGVFAIYICEVIDTEAPPTLKVTLALIEPHAVIHMLLCIFSNLSFFMISATIHFSASNGDSLNTLPYVYLSTTPILNQSSLIFEEY